jgi:hypothetical protein
MKATIEKLFPKETKLKFKNIDKELTVQTITLADDAWMMHEFGGKAGIISVFESSDLRSLVKILYRLLSNEDKIYLGKIQFNTVDEEGTESPVKSNIDKILFLVDVTDTKVIIKSLIDSRGASLPEIIADDIGIVDDKKKAKLKK